MTNREIFKSALMYLQLFHETLAQLELVLVFDNY